LIHQKKIPKRLRGKTRRELSIGFGDLVIANAKPLHVAGIVAEAKQRGMGILALKAMAKQKWQNVEHNKAYPKCWYEPISDPKIAGLALRRTLSQGITAAIPPGEEKLFRMVLETAIIYKELSVDELSKLEKLSIGLQHIFSA
jgi:hypothetical protein